MLFVVPAAAAVTVYTVDPAQSKITCAVRYTLVGKYVTSFSDFSGTFSYDPQHLDKSSVQFAIETRSLRSKHPRLDRAARSRLLLDSARYPQAIFTGTRVITKKTGLFVEGTLSLHGIIHDVSFPFSVEGPYQDQKGRSILKVHGKSVVNRKDYQVRWSAVLDHGGVVVSDTVVIDWELVYYKE